MARRAPFPSRLFLAAVVLSVLVLASLVMAAPALAQAGVQPKRGGVIRIAEREAPGLDPHLSISFLTHSYVSLAYSQLVRFPNGPEQKSPTDFSILPDLAEKWTVSKDGKVYTFNLRKGRQVPQQAAGERPRGDGGRREVLARALHGQVRLPRPLRAGDRHRGGGPPHGQDHAQGALRALPEPPGEPELLRHPAARGGGEVQGLQQPGRGHRHRPLRAEVLREGRARRLRAQPELLHEGPALSGRRHHRHHARRGGAPGRAARGQGGAAAHLGLDQPGGGADAQADQPRDVDHALQGDRPGLHLPAHRPAAVQRRASAPRGVAGHRPQVVERRPALRRGVRGRGPRALRADRLEARCRQDGPGQGQVRRRLRPGGGQAPARGGGLRQGLHDAHLPLAGLRGAVAQLLRAGRRGPGQGRASRWS